MFVDDINLFYMNKNIKTLLETANNGLQHVNDWFKANKLSINAGKTNLSFLYSIPLRLTILKLNTAEI